MNLESSAIVRGPRTFGFLLASLLGAPLLASLSSPASPVAGVVKHLRAPVPGALVLVYGVSEPTYDRAKTRLDGSFAFDSVPAGIYDVIAYKSGYYPSLVRLWHEGSSPVSTLAIDLVSEPPLRGRHDADVWSWRDRLPADVLRELAFEEAEPASPGSVQGVRLSRNVEGDFSALSDWGRERSTLTRSALALSGSLPGSVQYAFRGSYSALTSSDTAPLSSGSASAADLALSDSAGSALGLAYGRRQFDSPVDGAVTRERESVRWNREDESGQTFDVRIDRAAESGFDQATSVRPDLLPSSSTSYALRGRWSRDADSSRFGIALQVGSRRYVPGDEDGGRAQSASDANLSLAAERSLSELLAIGALVDGRYAAAVTSLAPGATIRLRFSPSASLLLSASRRVPSGQRPEGIPPQVVSADALPSAGHSDARALLSIGEEPAHLELSAGSQSIAEPLRLEFDGDTLIGVGSLYLFDGSRLVRLSGRASARVTNELSASLSAEGGRVSGGLSDDTRSQFALTTAHGHYYGGEAAVTVRRTHTDVRCAVRRVRQVLSGDAGMTQNNSDMVRVSLGQDLSLLGFDPFGTAWRLLLAYETDNSSIAQDANLADAGPLKKRVLGGLSISF